MNKKRFSFKNSRKLHSIAALAAAAFLSGCAGTPAPCVEPAVAPSAVSTPETVSPAAVAPAEAVPAATESVVPATQPETATAPSETTPAATSSAETTPAVQNQTTAAQSTVPAEKTVPQEPAKEQAVSTERTTPAAADSTDKTVTEPAPASYDSNTSQKVEPTETPKDTATVQPVIVPVVPVDQPADTTKQAVDTTAAVKPEEQTAKQDTLIAPDPYQAFPALANNVFAYADTLYKQGMLDSAVAYLQRFRIIKPLWSQWENTADSLLNEFGKTNAELAKQYEPLVLQIKNMNRVQTSYSIVAETADSLIALAPGDSLTRFANEQKQIAYSNTLKRAQKEVVTIKTMAEQRAQFAEAEQRALDFQMRYRDFENDLQIQALIDYIRELAQSAGTEATKYWDKHDPAKAMEEAQALINSKKYIQAKELLTKLKASNLRKEAMEKYVELADLYCNTQRKETSQIFAKAQKQKKHEKKKELLQSAIAPLDKCLAEFPESTLIQKVQDNKKFLEKELEK